MSAAAGQIKWSVNDMVLGTAPSDRAYDWPLTPGRHRIVATDARGRTAEAHIVVR